MQEEYSAAKLFEGHTQHAAKKSDLQGAIDHFKAVVLSGTQPTQQESFSFMLTKEAQQLGTAIKSLRANAESVTVDLMTNDVDADVIRSVASATKCKANIKRGTSVKDQ